MASITLLPPPEYTEDEREALIDFVLALKKTYIRSFLQTVKLPRSGTKPDLRQRLQEALAEGHLTYERLIDFLDSVAPWGKQHVFLYQGPRADIQSWKDPNWVLQRLKGRQTDQFFNARLPLILPEELMLSSITHSEGKLRVTAVQKHTYTERSPEHDDQTQTEDGVTVLLKAYVHHLSRILVAFEWDLFSNTAMLQITQLHRDMFYEQVAKEFFGLVGDWLDVEKTFVPVDIRQTIKKLHELEKNNQAEARSHGIHYRTVRGRRLSAQSPSSQDSVLGEDVIDDAMEGISKTGVGHLGNFYWLPGVQTSHVANPLENDVHIYIVGDKSRINFPTPNSEEVIRYVLHRVRTLS